MAMKGGEVYGNILAKCENSNRYRRMTFEQLINEFVGIGAFGLALEREYNAMAQRWTRHEINVLE
jgi:hypothetical protein